MRNCSLPDPPAVRRRRYPCPAACPVGTAAQYGNLAGTGERLEQAMDNDKVSRIDAGRPARMRRAVVRQPCHGAIVPAF